MKLTQKAELRLSPVHRFGVFASRNIRKGEIIEECPFLQNHSDINKNHPGVRDYLFAYGRRGTILLLGYGSLYNHRKDHNAEYFLNEENEVIEIHASEDIRKGEEIFIHYGNPFWNSRSKKPK